MKQHWELFQIIAPNFTAGITMDNNIVVGGAPIVKYMLGWNLIRLYNYCKKHHWDLRKM